MKTLNLKTALLGAALTIGTIALASTAMADKKSDRKNKERMYEVTITNTTLGQPVAPSVFATHKEGFQLFELGPAPMPGESGYDDYFALAAMAETGYPFHVLDQVSASRDVWEAVALLTDRMPPVLLPGESNSTVISATGTAKYLSAVGMLGATNDAIYAVRGTALPRGIGDTTRVFAYAYDAGSEANEESRDTIGALGAPTDGDDPVSGTGINTNGEGYIHVHAGVHGIGGVDGLSAATHDWRGPVVELTIERIE